MKTDTSRRNFLAAGLALPVAGLASTTSSPNPSPEPPQASAPAKGKITYRTLGKTGMKVSTVGMGCMITTDSSVITRAADLGINYFDTSRYYQQGNNERMVGAALGARRKDVFISSKCDPPRGGGVFTAQSAMEQLDTSLKELNTDHLDVWLLHGLGEPGQITDELVEAQRKAKQAGKVRFIGVSTHALPAIVDRVIEVKFDVCQPQINFTSQATFAEGVKKLGDAGVGVIAMKVMGRAGGGRRGGGQPAVPPPVQRFAAALKWAINTPGVATTVPSMTDNEQLDQNLAVMSQPFTDDDKKILTAALEQISPYFCRMCGQCSGQCPKGLQVSDMVRFAMYADGYGQFALGRENFLKLPAEHQAVRCGDCATCAVKCPNGVHVARQVSRAQELFA